MVEDKPVKTKYVVELDSGQRQHLEKITSSGTKSARQIKHAQILLKSDQSTNNWSYKPISEAYGVSDVTIAKVRRSFFVDGFEAALQRKKPNREYERRIDGDAEAYLIAITCSDSPEGYERWSLRLLQTEMVSRGHVKTVSHEAIRQTLKKISSNRG